MPETKTSSGECTPDLKEMQRRISELEARAAESERLRRQAAKKIDLLQKIAEMSISVAGDPSEVFNKLVGMLAELLHVPVVGISEILGDQLHILSVHLRGETISESRKCELSLTPCSTVQETKDIQVHHNVQSKFPRFDLLKAFDAHSYCGFPSLDQEGNVLAVTCLLDDQKHEFTDEDRQIIGLFADRIGFEIERQKQLAERRRMEESLIESEAKYRSLVESSEDSIYLVDRDYRYLYMNRKHLERMGFLEDYFIGKSYGEYHSTEETRDFMKRVELVFRTGAPLHYEYRSLKNSKYYLRTLSPVKDPEGAVVAVTVISKNISHLKDLEEKLLALSLTDELTGVYNRRGFFTHAEQQLKIANRSRKGMFMLFADLDDLKKINDSFGHQEGDRVLVDTARLLKQTFRDSDIIARVGGDEFVVFPAGITDTSTESITSRLQGNLDSLNAAEGRNYRISLSVGIGFYDPASPTSLDELLAQGDALMYQQKKKKQRP